MYHNLATKLISFFISQNDDIDVDKEVAIYGAELFFSSFINTIIAVIIGFRLRNCQKPYQTF